MRILFLLIGPSRIASSRVRILQYLPRLQREKGILARVLVSGSVSDREYPPLIRLFLGFFLKRLRSLRIRLELYRVHRYDLAFIHRLLLSEAALQRITAAGTKIIFDYDDALTIEGFHSPGEADRRFRNVLQRANAVITSTSLNARAITHLQSNVSVIISSVDLDRSSPPKRHAAASPVVIGWIGSASTTPYIDEIRGALKDLAAQCSIVLRLVGADPTLRIEGVPCEYRPWKLDNESADLRSFDIGVMPLPDTEWTRAKGGYKLLQYMAIGLPVVASPVGVNTEIVKENETGFLASSRREWTEKLALLVADVDLRSRLGANGRRLVESQYSSTIAYQKLIAVLNSVVRS